MRLVLPLLLSSLLVTGCVSNGQQASKPGAGQATVGAGRGNQGTAPANNGAAARRRVSPYPAAQEDPNTRGHYVAGGLYRPGVADTVPSYIPDVDAIPEPEVVHEPRSRYGNRSPYTVLGRQYTVMDDHRGFVETGMASYYGNKFHGRRTSNQEVYDMYAFTAAHKSLPLPSFARVTNLENGRSVVVRVNDRGPFHEGRVIDLSYAAAVKLGYRDAGTARVEVRALLPDDVDIPPVIGSTPANTTAPQPRTSAASAAAPTTRQSRRAARRAARAAARQQAQRTEAAIAAVSAPVNTATAINNPMPSTAPSTNPAPATVNARFAMAQGSRAVSADEFDAWMQQNQYRVATGVPTRVEAAAAPSISSTAAAQPALSTGEQVILQVASFANQDNAGQALARLLQANIQHARLHDAAVDGRRIWRLRVGPVPLAREQELLARIASLGFGAAQRVRE